MTPTRGSLTINVAQIWGAGGGRAAPPRTPLLSGGLRPLDPPKGAPRPLLQRLFAFSRPSHLSGAATLPGAERFPRNLTFFLNKPLVPGSFAAWGRTFSQNMTFFEQATCPGQLRCLGQNCFSKYDLFLGTSHLSWAASLPGAELVLKI